MKNIILFLILSATVFCQTLLYVSVNGNDSWSGRSPTRVGAAADGPYLTLTRALAEVSKIQQASAVPNEINNGFPKGGVTIAIRGGKYYLSSTLTIDSHHFAQDSTRPLRITAYQNETVILSSSVPVMNFGPVTDKSILSQFDNAARKNIVVADVSSFANSLGAIDSVNNHFDLLYNGEQMKMSRYPKSGFIDYSDTASFVADGLRRYKLKILPDIRMAAWKRDTNSFAFGYWTNDFYSSYQRLYDIETAGNQIVLTGKEPNYGYSPMRYGRLKQRFCVMNVLSEVNQPGDYYLNRNTRQLYFYPPTLLTTNPEISLNIPAVLLYGCKNIALSNLIIEGGTVGLKLQGCDNVTVQSCIIRNSKIHNLFVEASRNITVRSNDIYNCNSGAVIINLCGDRPTLTSGNIKIVQNKIHDFNKQFIAVRGGVAISSGVGVLVQNNKVYNSRSIGIDIKGNDNIIEQNEIYNLMIEEQEVGAIYSWGDVASQGNVIRNNYIHDCLSAFRLKEPDWNYRTPAIHIDGCAGSFTITGNVIVNCGNGVFIEGGSDNIIQNNIFYKCYSGLMVSIVTNQNAPYVLPARLLFAKQAQCTGYINNNCTPNEVWLKYPKFRALLGDTSLTMKDNIFTNNIAVKVDYLYGKLGGLPDPSKHPRAVITNSNYISNDKIPFDESALNFTISKYKSEIDAINFQPVSLPPEWGK